MTNDAEAYRAESRDSWERVAAGWRARADEFERHARPVTEWMLQAVAPRPGQTLLELAGGPGDVGLAAAPLVAPDGKVIITDGAEPMVAAAAERAKQRGVANVETRAMEAEWIDLPAASVDGVLCRWGYMLLADAGAALRETRRVLRPNGRVALAAWAEARRNPWSSAIGVELVERGLMQRPAPGEPGQFAWASPGRVMAALEDAPFFDVEVTTIEFAFEYPDLDAWWDSQVDRSPTLLAALTRVDPATRDEIMEACQARLAEHVRPDGTVAIPAASHVAVAGA